MNVTTELFRVARFYLAASRGIVTPFWESSSLRAKHVWHDNTTGSDVIMLTALPSDFLAFGQNSMVEKPLSLLEG